MKQPKKLYSKQTESGTKYLKTVEEAIKKLEE